MQLTCHSPTSRYGQLSCRCRFDHLDLAAAMSTIADEIDHGRFTDEWDPERAAGHPELARLRDEHASELVRAVDEDLRNQLD